MPITAGLIGFGLAGRYLHTPLVKAAGFNVAAVVSSRKDEVHSTLPDAVTHLTDSELLARRDIDLVVIATPTQLHAAQVRVALEAGKHVVVDKPISASAEEARALAHLAQLRGRMLAVFQNRRWDSDFLTLRKLLREDRLGHVNGYHARWDRFRPDPPATWRNQPDPASSMLYDLGSHLIDQVLVLFGMPDWIQADVFTQRPAARTEDGFEILMGKGTLRVTLGVSYLASDGGWRYRVHGSKASYLKAELDPQEGQLRTGMRPDDPLFGVEQKEAWGKLVQGANGRCDIVPSERGRWLTFYESVRQSIEHGAPPPVSALEAAQVIEVIEAAYTSSREGRRVNLGVTTDS